MKAQTLALLACVALLGCDIYEIGPALAALDASQGRELVLADRCSEESAPLMESRAESHLVSLDDLADDERTLTGCDGIGIDGPDGFLRLSAAAEQRWSILVEPLEEETDVVGREIAQRFLRATLRGWLWAIDPANRDQATALVIDLCGDTCQGSGSRQSAEVHQRWQLERVSELVQPGQLGEPEVTVGCLDRGDYDETLRLLREMGFVREGTGDDLLRPELLTEAGIACP